MDILLKKALDEIPKLHHGEIFIVKDLFKGYELKRLPLSERRNLGKNFFDETKNKFLNNGMILSLDKSNSNQQKYMKI